MTRAAALGLLALAVAGCAVLGPRALDMPPGQRAVLGRLDLSSFESPEASLDLVKVDGTFAESLQVSNTRSEFAIPLPPGSYRVTLVRAMKDRASMSGNSVWPLRLGFEVGDEPATYIGTLRLGSGFGRDLRVEIADEYDRTLPALRRLYTNLPDTAARRLLAPIP